MKLIRESGGWAEDISDPEIVAAIKLLAEKEGIFAETAGDEGSVLRAVQVALVGRHYERMADHAVTIAERVQFMVTGTHPGQATDD